MSLIRRGTITDCHANALFSVALDDIGHTAKARIAGKLISRGRFIQIVLGDIVDVKLCQYDLSKGRIVHRYNEGGDTFKGNGYNKRRRKRKRRRH